MLAGSGPSEPLHHRGASPGSSGGQNSEPLEQCACGHSGPRAASLTAQVGSRAEDDEAAFGCVLSHADREALQPGAHPTSPQLPLPCFDLLLSPLWNVCCAVQRTYLLLFVALMPAG